MSSAVTDVRRVLLAPFGTYGDLAPFLPIGEELRSRGTAVTFAGDRALMMGARARGFQTVAIGPSQATTFSADHAALGTRFGGYSSWRRVLNDYVTPALRDGLGDFERMWARIEPDVVVHHPLALHARLSARLRGIPTVALHLHPMLYAAVCGSTRRGQFALELGRLLRSVEREHDLPTLPRPSLRWGWGERNVLLQDPALLERAGVALPEFFDCPAIGFPTTEPPAPGINDEPAVVDWRKDRRGARVAISFGSFLGAMHAGLLIDVATALGRDHSVLVMNAPGETRQALEEEGIRAVGFVDFRSVGPWADAMVHHGGLGTMMEALRAGVRSVVVPLAFDQLWNGSVLERAGCGTVSAPSGPAVLASVGQTLDDECMLTQVNEVGSRLTRDAGAFACDVIEAEGAVGRPGEGCA